MQPVVYGDVLLIINFCMDYLALYITSYLLRIKYNLSNVVLAALVGALYSLVCIIANNESLCIAIIVAVLMCLIAFYGSSMKYLIYEIVVFFAVNFLLGGGMTAVFNLFNSMGNRRELMLYGELHTIDSNLPTKVFMLGFSVIAVLAITFSKVMTKESHSEKSEISITISNDTAFFTVREDSGDLLTEPISGDPVIFLTESALLKLLDKDELSAIRNIELQNIKNKNIKTRLIVYETVKGKELCACFRPTRIKSKEKEFSAWIAIGENVSFGGCDGIVPASLLN